MSLQEGETLAERLKKGALPLEQALEYGIQIANGLDTAHRAGIVHRDLPPPNVMLTKSGVKLLDYGHAKLVEEDVGPETSDAPTRQKHLTQEDPLSAHSSTWHLSSSKERPRGPRRTSLLSEPCSTRWYRAGMVYRARDTQLATYVRKKERGLSLKNPQEKRLMHRALTASYSAARSDGVYGTPSGRSSNEGGGSQTLSAERRYWSMVSLP